MKKSGKKTAANGLPFKAAAAHLVPLLIKAVDDAKQIVQEGQGLVSSAPSQFMGLNALKLPQVLKSLKSSLENLASGISDAKDALGGLRGGQEDW